MIDARLWQNYRDSYFCFTQWPEWDSYAIVTAWNPASQRLSNKDNHANNQRLLKALSGFNYVQVRVGNKDFSWVEDSFAVAIPLERARRLAQQFGQNAIYFIQSNRLYLYSCIDSSQVCIGDLVERIDKEKI
ncbi:DUF3293 domain-containing protein [Vibrio sp.]|uniref:DUF3293 domain-containing protein n=1 Tax=Vibrio sp. TaxID=678 RepID=UPI003D125B7F